MSYDRTPFWAHTFLWSTFYRSKFSQFYIVLGEMCKRASKIFGFCPHIFLSTSLIERTIFLSAPFFEFAFCWANTLLSATFFTIYQTAFILKVVSLSPYKSRIVFDNHRIDFQLYNFGNESPDWKWQSQIFRISGMYFYVLNCASNYFIYHLVRYVNKQTQLRIEVLKREKAMQEDMSMATLSTRVKQQELNDL